MGDLAGYTIKLMCCACHEKYEGHTWRGDRLYTFQLCEPCRLSGHSIRRERDDGRPAELLKDERLVRALDPEKDAFNAKDGQR